ncbi:MAG: hypothetical protein ABI813_03425 [Bacteroidota bacterium]
MTQFVNSIQWRFDGFDAKITKDPIQKVLAGEWQNAHGIKVNMGDYESVISKDKKKNTLRSDTNKRIFIKTAKKNPWPV